MTDLLDDEPEVERGSVVILHLQEPREKIWGLVLRMNALGISFRGIDLSSFDDWVTEVASGKTEMTMGLTTAFVPMHRVEKIILDNQVGAARSCSQDFERRTRMNVLEYLRGGSVPPQA